MKFIDWFAGIGGFRKGLELSGHECIGFCEFDKFAYMSYVMMHTATAEQISYVASIDAPPKKNGDRNLNKRQKEILKEEYRNGEWYANDVSRVFAGDIPRADMWTFGFPCQDISVAGKQAGFNGKRSSLFFKITGLIRDLEEKDRPSTLLIENVKNLLSVNRGFDFLKVLIELDEIGYDAEWQVLQSSDFGVPQNRLRTYVVGHLRGRSRRKVFPISGTYEKNNCKQVAQMYGTEKEPNPQAGRIYDARGVSPSLDSCGGGE